MSAITDEELAAVQRASEAAGEYLSIGLGDEEYGIEILRIQEIFGYRQPTKIVGAPNYVCGVLNLRGIIVPIIDLRVRLDLEPRFDDLTVTVVLNIGGKTIGVIVDSVSDVLTFAADAIKPAPGFPNANGAKFITGLGTFRSDEQERMLILLDIEQALGGAGLSS